MSVERTTVNSGVFNQYVISCRRGQHKFVTGISRKTMDWWSKALKFNLNLIVCI
jgi:hypothetical protein